MRIPNVLSYISYRRGTAAPVHSSSWQSSRTFGCEVVNGRARFDQYSWESAELSTKEDRLEILAKGEPLSSGWQHRTYDGARKTGSDIDQWSSTGNEHDVGQNTLFGRATTMHHYM